MSKTQRLSVMVIISLSIALAVWAQPRGRGGMGAGRMGRGGAFNSPVQAKDDWEKAVLAVLDDMDKTQRRGNMNVPVEDGRLLRLFAESIQAKHVVEIGTSTGYSGIWFCLALQKTQGKLTTYEIDATRANIARANFKRAGVDDLVTLVEGNAHQEVLKLTDGIDLLFLDADKEGYIDYLEKLLPKIRSGGLIISHNMNTRQADPKFVEAITTNKDLETLFLHMDGSGVSVTLKKH
jgi:caffeoyl-CoA O-methyltransferase